MSAGGTITSQVLKASGVAAVALLCIFCLTSPARSEAAWPNSVVNASQLATDSSGRVYVAASGPSQIVKYSPSGSVVQTIGSFGSGAGQFKHPQGVAVDDSGNIFVADTGNDRIFRLFPAGNVQSQWGSTGSTLGFFQGPTQIATDGSNVYIADTGNDRIVKCNGYGFCGTEFLFPGIGGIQYPSGVAVDSTGKVYVSDTGGNRIIKSNAAGTVQAVWSASGTGDGQVNGPSGLAIDGFGNLYVADIGNNRVQKFSTAGTFVQKWTGPGAGNFSGPQGVALDSSGSLFVGDTANGKVERIGGVIPPVTPTGESGVTGPTGPVGPTGPTGPSGGGGGGGGNSGGGGNNGGGGTEIPDPKPNITKVELTPGKYGWVYADGYLDMQVAVTNKGKRAAKMVEVSFGSSQKAKVKPKPEKLVIPRIKPGWTVTKNFKVTAKRSAYGTVDIYAYAGGKKDRSRLKLIRPYW